MRVEVVLVPVSVQMGSPLCVVGFRGGATWARRPVGRSARETARELVADLPAEYRHVVDELDIRPAQVTFKEEPIEGGSRLTLIYSIALPAPLADPDVPGAKRWTPLLESGGSHTEARQRGSHLLSGEPYAKNLVEYWREELEEKIRLFAFLPRYFTARQARDVYSAFWGYEQDPDGFATWSGIGQNKQGVLSDYVDEQDLHNGDLLRHLVDAVLNARSEVDAPDPTSSLTDVDAALLAQRASDGAIGLWPKGAVDSAPEQALAPLLVAACLVAYQRKSRGPKPTWYQRKAARPLKKRLERLYSPRAVWVFPPQH